MVPLSRPGVEAARRRVVAVRPETNAPVKRMPHDQSVRGPREQMFQEAKDNVRKTARTQKAAWREEELGQKLKVKVEEVSEGKESENGEKNSNDERKA